MTRPSHPSGDQPDNQRRKVTWEKVEVVKALIERSIQKYMTKSETISALWENAGIDPAYTTVVWEYLEKGNEEFFAAYYPRLKMKHLIVTYNQLLEQQIILMERGQKQILSSLGHGPDYNVISSNNIPSFHMDMVNVNGIPAPEKFPSNLPINSVNKNIGCEVPMDPTNIGIIINSSGVAMKNPAPVEAINNSNNNNGNFPSTLSNEARLSVTSHHQVESSRRLHVDQGSSSGTKESSNCYSLESPPDLSISCLNLSFLNLSRFSGQYMQDPTLIAPGSNIDIRTRTPSTSKGNDHLLGNNSYEKQYRSR